ncbi:MAG: TIGR01777 family protein [Deltaproteobacteria bacterium]|nr:MAG: TIGR01777 family protein [Deltaproteobacteria bacterium]
MRVLVSGASGFIGSALVTALEKDGAEVWRLVRRLPPGGVRALLWDPLGAGPDLSSLPPVDAVVHLAGAPIAAGRWTRAHKAAIWESRVRGTRHLAAALAALPEPPGVLISASAVGYYGDRGDEVLTEASPPGEGFLAELCQAWEAAGQPAREAGIRVVHPRIGLVLGRGGGALARMLPVFRLGLGGPLGSGRQWMSWIHLDDVVAAIRFALAQEALEGPVNLTAPHPVRNRDFTRLLARQLRRPACLPVPAAALRLGYGEMAEALLLAGQRVHPARLAEAGFNWHHPRLEAALAACF